MQLNIQELQTISHYNIPIKIFVFNNHVLGNTKAYQIQNLDGRTIACGPEGYSAPNFVRVSAAYGIHSYSVQQYRDVFGLLDDDKPMLVDVVHPDFCDYRPRMTLWDAGIEEMYPVLPKDEFLSNMTVPPLLGWEERTKKYKDMP